MTALVKTAPSTAVVSSPAHELMRPLAAPAEVLSALDATRAMLREALVEGVDFGVIPGTDKDKKKAPKKVLMKPGAEKIAFGFGCRGEYDVIEKEIDHSRVMRFRVPWVEAPDPGRAAKEQLKADGKGRSRMVDGEWQWQVPGDGYEEATGLYRYVVKCRVVRFDGVVVGEGIGSCSSLESKYRSRPHDVENTVLKMAEKRAFIAAVLGTFALSEAFTQDLDDDTDEKPARAATTAPAARASQTPRATTPSKPTDALTVAKRAAFDELVRLGVGKGLDKTGQGMAMNKVLERGFGKVPTTVEEWTKAVTFLKTQTAQWAPDVSDEPVYDDGPQGDAVDDPPEPHGHPEGHSD